MNEAKKYNILLLCGSLGDGHKQAARAIADAAQETRNDIKTTVVDFDEWTHPYLHVFWSYCYSQWMKKLPFVYGYLFKKTRSDKSQFTFLLKKTKIFTLNRMMKLLDEVQPTVVVSTFPPAAATMSILKANGLVSITTITVITDHTDHSYWIHPNTDHYLVGSEWVRCALLRQGVANHRITVTGIPVRPQFNLTYNREQLFEKHDLQTTMPTVLIMGGGLGMISETFIRMLQIETRLEPTQFIIICARNKKIKQRISEQLQSEKHHFIVEGYVDYIHELMALSDLIITKPGGLTTAEAMALELPMLLYKPIPGQEQDNASFLLQAEIAIIAIDENDLLEKLVNAFQNPQVLSTLKLNTKKLQTKPAACRALTSILNTQNFTFEQRSK